MEDWQQRVVDEKNELDDKLSRLAPFFSSEKYNELSDQQKSLLQRQYILMQLYSETLELRIEYA